MVTPDTTRGLTDIKTHPDIYILCLHPQEKQSGAHLYHLKVLNPGKITTSNYFLILKVGSTCIELSMTVTATTASCRLTI